jgi:hypothetical protein
MGAGFVAVEEQWSWICALGRQRRRPWSSTGGGHGSRVEESRVRREGEQGRRPVRVAARGEEEWALLGLAVERGRSPATVTSPRGGAPVGKRTGGSGDDGAQAPAQQLRCIQVQRQRCGGARASGGERELQPSGGGGDSGELGAGESVQARGRMVVPVE